MNIDKRSIYKALQDQSFIVNDKPNSYRARYLKAEEVLVGALQQLYPMTDSVSEMLYLVANGLDEPPTCPQCGSQLTFRTIAKPYGTYCSSTCSNRGSIAKKQATMQERYGATSYSRTDAYKQKTRATWRRNWGVNNPNQSASIKAKKEASSRKRYGTSNVSQATEVKAKVQATKFKKSADNVFYSDRLRMLVTPAFSEQDYAGIDKMYSWTCNTCGTVFEDHLKFGKVPTCPTCYKSSMPFSKVEHEIRNFVRSLGYSSATSSREVVSPKEVDIWVPEKQLAIEINGLYHHSEAQGNKDKDYHLYKTKVCENKGIVLLHFWDSECVQKRDIVQSVIRNKLGNVSRKIGARSCVVRDVSNKDADAFFNENHLQGAATYSVRLGLYYKEELVSLVGLSKARHTQRYDWELIRFASALDTQVLGGFSKLLKAFRSKHPGSIITYADKRISTGEVYKRAGFKHSHTTKPNYWYTAKPRRYDALSSRLRFQKHKLKDMPSYRANLTEWQIMQLEGYDRVWDCGNEVFTLQ